MATTLETKMTTLARIVEAVVVTTVWTPPTSLASRDWISPVLVFVKKESGESLQVRVEPVGADPA